MDKKALIDAILEKEWPMFHNVNGEDRVDCQEDPTTFYNMRTAQFDVWNEDALESYNKDLTSAGRTLGLSDLYIFWRIKMPACKQGIIAGIVLAFARALGEYGATSMLIGYTPGRTATISTTVYQMWRTGNDVLAFRWVMVNVAISAVVLLTVNMLEKKNRQGGR